MNQLRQLFFLLIVLTFVSPAARAVDKKTLIDSLKIRLSELSNPADSVSTLYDLYDLSQSPNSQGELLRTLFYTARRSGDISTQLDAARRFSINHVDSDSAFKKLEEVLFNLPQSQERDETIVFVTLQYINKKAAGLNDDERLQKIATLITEEDDYNDETQPEKRLDHLLKLYTIVIYLSNEFNSSILPEYIEKLDVIMQNMELSAIRNQFYSQAANAYTSIGNSEKAIEADRKLLKVIDIQEEKAKAQGRKFINLNRFRYNCYRRILGNYSALSPEDIEAVYDRIDELAEKDSEIAATVDSDTLLEAYYLMATEQYADAIPVIKQQLANKNSKTRTMRLLNMLRLAAKNANDQQTLMQAMRDYNDLMEELNPDNQNRKYRELQIKYQANKLRNQNAVAEIEKRDSKLHSANQMMWFSIGGLAVVLILLTVIFFSYRKASRLSGELAASIANLETERDSLKEMHIKLVNARNRAEASNKAKDQFLHSMSHELRTPLNAILGFSRQIVRKVPEESRDKISRYVDIINRNGIQLEKIIDDVLYLSSIDLHQIGHKIEELSASEVINDTAALYKSLLHKDVELKVILPEEDIVFESDRRSTEQVLSNLLNNAIKFTSEGFVEVKCELDKRAQKVVFIVTDSGCGIPAEMRDIVFERFSKLNDFSPGIGLGLYISRQISQLLGGDLYIDFDYKGQGTRIVLTLPLKHKKTD